MRDAGTFAVTSFKTVYDVAPDSEAVSLDALVRTLLRFELKEELGRKVAREQARINAGQSGRLQRKVEELGLDKALKEAGDAAKKELRLWSPALYPPGARRGSEQVIHLSCLVLDFDAGVGVDDARRRFDRFLHVIHSTWTHRVDRPRFRMCLPLAAPVLAAEWEAVWAFGFSASGGAVDRALKGVGSTFALPATPAEDAPRIGIFHEAPLLDPFALGLARTPGMPIPPRTLPLSPFAGGDPAKRWLQVEPQAEAFDVESAFEDLF